MTPRARDTAAALADPRGAGPRPSAPPPATRDTRTFSQARAKETYQALIAAAAEVFAEKGFDAAQSPDIAQRAGVSVGTFYRYFADKRQAFIELIRAHLSESYDSVMANLTLEHFGDARTAADRRAAVDQVVDVLFSNVEQNPDLHHVFLSLSLRDPDVSAIQHEFDELARQALALLIEQVTPRERIPDPLAAAEVIQVAAQQIAFSLIGNRAPKRKRAEAKALRAALSDMLYAYVFGAR
ncbi:MAG: TetR/AcrR family transcriptional regulator [Polyangiaceae bacterium]|nr:TetR/AcrR family transcriptional regulator [Polyangiaceae bacterium]